jgi:hypothetical protein
MLSRYSQQVALRSNEVQFQVVKADAEWHGGYGLHLSWWPEGSLNYNVDRYSGGGMSALKEKLAQFPAGTHLKLITTRTERNHHQSEFAELEVSAAAQGLILNIQTPRFARSGLPRSRVLCDAPVPLVTLSYTPFR